MFVRCCLRGDFMKQEKFLCSLSDEELAAMVGNGDDSAFEEIAQRYKKLISHIAARYCNGEHDLCDLTQEGLLGLLSACKSYDVKGGSSFKNYAALCIKRKFISILRRDRAKSAVPKESIVSIEDIDISDAGGLNPEEIIVSRERLGEFLTRIKSSLSRMEISVIYLYLQGLSYDEIGKKAGLSKKSVDNALQRIKKKLNSKP